MEGHGRYILNDNGRPIPCEDLFAWAEWMEKSHEKRVVERTQIDEHVRVSTVFLGLDHNFFSGGNPILFESMIFGGPHDQHQERYRTREEAQRGHQAMVEWALNAGTKGAPS
jgi:hypothetical protein